MLCVSRAVLLLFLLLLLLLLVGVGVTGEVRAVLHDQSRLRGSAENLRLLEPGSLVGIFPGGPFRFEWIDKRTGNFSHLGEPLDQAFSQAVGSYDSRGGIYWTISQGFDGQSTSVCGIDTMSGSVARRVRLPFAAVTVNGFGHYAQFDPRTGNVYAFGRAADPSLKQQHVIYTVTPSSDVSLLTTGEDPNTIGEVIPGCSAFDPPHRLLWLMAALGNGNVNLHAFNVSNGAHVFSIGDNYHIVGLEYDSKTGDLYGIGLREDPTRPIPQLMFSFLRISTVTGKQQRLRDLPEFYDMLLGITAFDPQTRILYSLQKLSPGAAGRTVQGNRLTASAHYFGVDERLSDDFDYTLVTYNVDTNVLGPIPEPCSYDCPNSMVVVTAPPS